MFEQVRKRVRVNAQKYKRALEADEAPRHKPSESPFEALKLGHDHFIETWLKESEFQRLSLR